jgi:hypothetical protein
MKVVPVQDMHQLQIPFAKILMYLVNIWLHLIIFLVTMFLVLAFLYWFLFTGILLYLFFFVCVCAVSVIGRLAVDAAH